MAGAFLVVVAAAAADVCRWYAAPYSITIVSVKVASDFGWWCLAKCVFAVFAKTPPNAVKSAAVLNRLDYFLRTYFGHFRLINWWHWSTKSTAAARKRDIVITKTVFYYYFRDLSYLQEVP